MQMKQAGKCVEMCKKFIELFLLLANIVNVLIYVLCIAQLLSFWKKPNQTVFVDITNLLHAGRPLGKHWENFRNAKNADIYFCEKKSIELAVKSIKFKKHQENSYHKHETREKHEQKMYTQTEYFIKRKTFA